MIFLEIPESGRKIYMPENLSECDYRQYAEACLLIYRHQMGELSYEDMRVDMVYKLLNLKKGKGKLVKSEVEDMDANIYRLSLLLDGFFNVNEQKQRTIKLGYIHNHSETIQDAFRKWYGPSDGFENVNFGQYIDALNLHALLEQDLNTEWLYEMMAIFYLPKGKEYSPDLAKKSLRHFRHVYFGRIYGFYLLFASFQEYLATAKVVYEGNELDLSILFQKGNKNQVQSSIPGIGMLSVAFQLSESQIFGTYQELRKMNLWEVLIRLYDIRKRDLEEKAKEKSNS